MGKFHVTMRKLESTKKVGLFVEQGNIASQVATFKNAKCAELYSATLDYLIGAPKSEEKLRELFNTIPGKIQIEEAPET